MGDAAVAGAGDLVAQACEYIDRLVTVEMRPSGLLTGITAPLYEAARARQGGQPLTLLVAEALRARLQPQPRWVVLSTGIGGPPYLPFGETDGPPGLAVLARALQLALGCRVVVVVEERYRAATIGALQAVGLGVASPAEAVQRPGCVGVLDFSFEAAEAERQARAILDSYEPGAVICVERPGPNRHGVIHTALGHDWPSPQSQFHRLVEEARRRGVLTVSMGEVGNEIGFGIVEDAVRRIVPYADRCQCPCGGGAVTSTRVDVLLVCSGCNWGAYAIEAALAAVSGKLEILHDPDVERELVLACQRAGAVDGVSGRAEPTVEGCSLEMSRSLAVLLRGMTENWLRGAGPSWLAPSSGQ